MLCSPQGPIEVVNMPAAAHLQLQLLTVIREEIFLQDTHVQRICCLKSDKYRKEVEIRLQQRPLLGGISPCMLRRSPESCLSLAEKRCSPSHTFVAARWGPSARVLYSM